MFLCYCKVTYQNVISATVILVSGTIYVNFSFIVNVLNRLSVVCVFFTKFCSVFCFGKLCAKNTELCKLHNIVQFFSSENV